MTIEEQAYKTAQGLRMLKRNLTASIERLEEFQRSHESGTIQLPANRTNESGRQKEGPTKCRPTSAQEHRP
jgi:hypothetical protein